MSKMVHVHSRDELCAPLLTRNLLPRREKIFHNFHVDGKKFRTRSPIARVRKPWTKIRVSSKRKEKKDLIGLRLFQRVAKRLEDRFRIPLRKCF